MTGPLPGFLVGVGLRTACSTIGSEAKESAASVGVTDPASARTSTTAPAASHGIGEPPRVFLVLV